MNGYLACSGLENKALNTNDIAHVPGLELLELLLADVVHAHIYLHTVGAVTNVDEVSLAHVSPGHDTACDLNIDAVLVKSSLESLGIVAALSGELCFKLGILLSYLRILYIVVKACYLKGVLAFSLELFKLFHSYSL